MICSTTSLKDLCIFLYLTSTCSCCATVVRTCFTTAPRRSARPSATTSICSPRVNLNIQLLYAIELLCHLAVAYQGRRPQLLVDGVGPGDPAALSEPEPLLVPSPLVPSPLVDPLSFAFSAPGFASSLFGDPLSFLALS